MITDTLVTAFLVIVTAHLPRISLQAMTFSMTLLPPLQVGGDTVSCPLTVSRISKNVMDELS